MNDPDGESTSPPEEFRRLVDRVAFLRSDQGCPWDREQTMDSMVENLVEETREVVEAVEDEDVEHLEEELGDLLLQVVFYAQMAREEELFDITDVLRHLNEKLVRRHPHVFGDAEAETPKEAIDRWREAKAEEQ